MIKELHNLVYIMLSHEKFMGGRIVDYRIEKRFIDKKIHIKVYKKNIVLIECLIFEDRKYLLGLISKELLTEEFETITHTLEDYLGLKSCIDNSGFYMMI